MARKEKIKFAMPYGCVVKDIRRWKKGYRYIIVAPERWKFSRGTAMMTDLPRWGRLDELKSLYRIMRV